MHLLRYLHVAAASGTTDQLHPNNVALEGSWRGHDLGGNPRAFLRAIAEAWSFLEAEGCFAINPTGSGGYYFVTRRGEQLIAEADPLRRLAAEDRLAGQLHPKIANRVRQQFLIGEYELSAFAAMKEVEIRVRELSSASSSSIGVNLMQTAFTEGGPLADPTLDPGERAATMALFWGAIGVFKNPSSHRQVEFDDPNRAAGVVLLADLLLHMLDDVDGRLNSPTPPLS